MSIRKLFSQRGTAKRKLLSFPKTPFQEFMWILTVFSYKSGRRKSDFFRGAAPPIGLTKDVITFETL